MCPLHDGKIEAGMSLRALVIAALVAAPAASAASTLEVVVIGGVFMGTNPGGISQFDYRPGPVETLVESRQENASASGDGGFGGAQATYVFNGNKGQLGLSVFSNVSANGLERRGASSCLIQMFVTESYFIAGTGSVTVGMEFTADWFAPTFYTLGSVTYNGSRGTTGVSFNTSSAYYESGPLGPGPGPGFVTDEIIQATFDVDTTGGLIDFIWRIDGSVGVGGDVGRDEAAFVNALNTANFFVLTEGDVIATPQTAGFLSKAVSRVVV
jgi:hypothetical protein